MVAYRKIKINHSHGKAEWFIFYLLKITTNAIIKAIFMIVTPTNPKKSSLIIIVNANSTISTTSHFNLTAKNCGYVNKKVATHSAYLISYNTYYTAFNNKKQANTLNFYKNFCSQITNHY